MFNNARSFNEDDSQLYKDAGTLEKAMKKKVMALSIADDPEEDVIKRFVSGTIIQLFLNGIHQFFQQFYEQSENLESAHLLFY